MPINNRLYRIFGYLPAVCQSSISNQSIETFYWLPVNHQYLLEETLGTANHYHSRRAKSRRTMHMKAYLRSISLSPTIQDTGYRPRGRLGDLTRAAHETVKVCTANVLCVTGSFDPSYTYIPVHSCLPACLPACMHTFPSAVSEHLLCKKKPRYVTSDKLFCRPAVWNYCHLLCVIITRKA